jgi:hypothetical protein
MSKFFLHSNIAVKSMTYVKIKSNNYHYNNIFSYNTNQAKLRAAEPVRSYLLNPML